MHEETFSLAEIDQFIKKISKIPGIKYSIFSHEGLLVSFENIDMDKAEEVMALASDLIIKTLNYKDIKGIRFIGIGYDGDALYIRRLDGFTLVIKADSRLLTNIHNIINRYLSGKTVKCSKCGVELDFQSIKCPVCKKEIPASSYRCPYCNSYIGLRKCPNCRTLIDHRGKVYRRNKLILVTGIIGGIGLAILLYITTYNLPVSITTVLSISLLSWIWSLPIR